MSADQTPVLYKMEVKNNNSASIRGDAPDAASAVKRCFELLTKQGLHHIYQAEQDYYPRAITYTLKSGNTHETVGIIFCELLR